MLIGFSSPIVQIKKKKRYIKIIWKYFLCLLNRDQDWPKVFRLNFGLGIGTLSKIEKGIDAQIELKHQYLKDLKVLCTDLFIPFDKSDRILYMAGKRINKGHK